MSRLPTRRAVLVAAGSLPFLNLHPSQAHAAPQDGFAVLETAFGGRLGVAALDTADGRRLGYRDGERFAFCSTFKILTASALLKRSETDPGLMDRRVPYAAVKDAANSDISKYGVGDSVRCV